MRLLLASLLTVVAATTEIPISYFRDEPCTTPHEFYLYPLHTCVLTSNANYLQTRVYSVHRPSEDELELGYKSYSTLNCSDDGTSYQGWLTLFKTCPMGDFYHRGTILDTPPELGPHHRYINFFALGGCNMTAQYIYHVHDGCAWVGHTYAKLECQPDGSSTVRFHGVDDSTCAQAPVGAPFTVQPFDCIVADTIDPSRVAYLTTSCVYGKPTELPTVPPA